MKPLHILALTLCLGLGIVLTFGYLSCSEQQMQEQPEFSQPPGFAAQQSELQASQERVKSGDSVRVNWNQIGLSSTQQKRLAGKRVEFQHEVVGLQQNLERVQQELAAMVWQETADQQKIETALDSMASLKQRISETALQNLLELTSLLTEEQRESLAAAYRTLPPQFNALRLNSEQYQ
jgi:Spy/CpxP family protein refolding chaperone